MMIKYKLINKDRTGNITTKQDSIYYLAFVKELSFAGINSNSPTLETYCRLLTNFFDFLPSFIHSRFHLHPDLENDPTERNQFSNKVGRTFAVYLAKKISGAKYVNNYECALKKNGFPISGRRPDYYCDTGTQTFSLEAKGSCVKSVSDSVMQTVKNQAQSSKLSTQFSIASKTYNIYNSPIIKFYDPEGNNKSYDTELCNFLRKDYYNGIINLLNSPYFTQTEKSEKDFYSYTPQSFSDLFQILIHKEIIETKDFSESLTPIETDNLFIDSDGIGLRINLDTIKLK